MHELRAPAGRQCGNLDPQRERFPARSGRARQAPFSADLNTVVIATESSEDAAYGRSLTYCASAASGAPPRPLPLPRLTSATGSTSSNSAAVQRSAVASG